CDCLRSIFYGQLSFGAWWRRMTCRCEKLRERPCVKAFLIKPAGQKGADTRVCECASRQNCAGKDNRVVFYTLHAGEGPDHFRGKGLLGHSTPGDPAEINRA